MGLLAGRGDRRRLPTDPLFRGCFQQGRHRWAFIHEDSHVALRLGQRQGAFHWHKRSRDVAEHVEHEGS
jgi:hypothetical protein